jgi:hypothetical protein
MLISIVERAGITSARFHKSDTGTDAEVNGFSTSGEGYPRR